MSDLSVSMCDPTRVPYDRSARISNHVHDHVPRPPQLARSGSRAHPSVRPTGALARLGWRFAGRSRRRQRAQLVTYYPTVVTKRKTIGALYDAIHTLTVSHKATVKMSIALL